MVDKFCPFCYELLNPEKNIVNKNRVIAQTKHFVVFPTIGGFVNNYQLIVPKEHINCFGELSKVQFSELKNIINWQEKINKNYFNSKYSMFEHGTLRVNDKSGKSIVHAHLHIFPNNKSLLEEICKYNFEIFRINEISDLSKICKEYNSYLYYRDIDGQNYIITHLGIPSQFLRKILANSLNIENWNWRENPLIDKIEESIDFYQKNKEVYRILETEE